MASAAVAMQEKGFAVTGSDQNVYLPMPGQPCPDNPRVEI